MLEIKGVDKFYKISKGVSEHALKEVSFKFEPGFNVILGKSGSGKSTLLNIIGGLDTDYQGDVFYNNDNLKNINLDIYRKATVAFIFQNFSLIPHLTVEGNILSALYLDETKNMKQRKQRALELLKSVGLEEFLDKLPTQLSGGQKQRVAIARALANNPDIIIADEPTGALDSKTALDIINILKELSDSGKTIIVVSHDKSFTSYANQVIELKDGQIIDKKEEEPKLKNDKIKLSNKKGISVFNSFKLSYSNFTNRIFRNSLVAVGTSIGIIGILLALGIGNGINKSVETLFGGILSPNSINVSIGNTQGGGGQPTIPMEQTDIDIISKSFDDNNIEEYYTDNTYVNSTLTYEGTLLTSDVDTPFVAFLQEMNLNDEKSNGYSVDKKKLLSGEPLESSKNGIHISTQTAAYILGVEIGTLDGDNTKELIGKNIDITLNIRTANGMEEYTITSTIEGVLSPDTFGSLMYLSSEAFDQLEKLSGQKPTVLSMTGFAKTPQDAQMVSEKYKDDKNYSYSTLGDVLEQISSLTDIITLVLVFVAGLSLVVATVMIAIVLYIGVIQRTREIGILRAIGYTKKNILIMFLWEAILIMISANVIAIIISYGMQYSINPILNNMIGFESVLDITYMNILIAVSVTVIIGLIAGLYPSIKASRLDPVESLRYE